MTDEWKTRNCGTGTCVICGATYKKQTANVQVCGDECRHERDNRRKRIGRGPLSGPTVSTCVVCGTQFQGRLPNYPYKCCGSVVCRREMRRRGGQKGAETVAKKLGAKSVQRECLKCGRKFRAENRFIRICVKCHGNFRANPIGADWYGAVI
jgi:hypothetical protein